MKESLCSDFLLFWLGRFCGKIIPCVPPSLSHTHKFFIKKLYTKYIHFYLLFLAEVLPQACCLLIVFQTSYSFHLKLLCIYFRSTREIILEYIHMCEYLCVWMCAFKWSRDKQTLNGEWVWNNEGIQSNSQNAMSLQMSAEWIKLDLLKKGWSQPAWL